MIGSFYMRQLKDSEEDKIINESFILQKCKELLNEAEIKKPPIDPEILASFCDIKRIIEENIKEAGILIPLPGGGAEIYLRKQDNKKRRRFTCCHEIIHTFFPDYQLNPQKRVDKEVGEYFKDNWIEYLCDFGASELLMPSFLFQPQLSKIGFSVNSLVDLSSRFESSLEATAIKMVRQNPQKTAVVIWEEKYKPVEKIVEHLLPLPGLEKYKPQKKLRVKFSYGFENFGHIPRDKSLVEMENIIQKSFVENKKLGGLEEINFGNFNIKCKVETLPLEYRDQRKILSFLCIE